MIQLPSPHPWIALTSHQALFSTTFFTFGDDGSWRVSGKLWIYWVVTVPATIIIVVLWWVWLANSDAITRFLLRGVARLRTVLGTVVATLQGRLGRAGLAEDLVIH